LDAEGLLAEFGVTIESAVREAGPPDALDRPSEDIHDTGGEEQVEARSHVVAQANGVAHLDGGAAQHRGGEPWGKDIEGQDGSREPVMDALGFRRARRLGSDNPLMGVAGVARGWTSLDAGGNQALLPGFKIGVSTQQLADVLHG